MGIWAAQFSAQHLERTWTGFTQKCLKTDTYFGDDMKNEGKEKMIFYRNYFSTKQFPSVVESSVSEVKSFLFYDRPISRITALPAQMVPVITPLPPFRK